MFSANTPRITYSNEFHGKNPFRDKFGKLSDDEWRDIWLATESQPNIQGVEFPTIPDQELQTRLHGATTWNAAIREAFTLYHYVKASGSLQNAQRFLDYGCGWGRIIRPFMRDFDLDKIYGFEPSKMLAIIARTLNPYVTIVSGDFLPDQTIPKDWFDLIVGRSIFSHLSESNAKAWLTEISSALRPGGRAVFTTWGLRFLKRLEAEAEQLAAGAEINWYSKLCIENAGNILELIRQCEAGEFVWFPESASKDYGAAFLGERPLKRFVSERQLPIRVIEYNDSALAQDVFIIERR